MRILYLTFLILLFSEFSYSQNFWEKCNGPYGGYISTIWVDSDGTLLAGTMEHGVAVSSDEGSHWNFWEVGEGHTSLWLYFIYRSEQTEYLYVGTNDGGLYITTDNGISWEQAALFDPTGIVEDSEGSLYASTDFYGIFKSTNNGLSWFPVYSYFGVPSFYTIAISTANNYIFAGSSMDGIYRSANSGQNWSQVNNGLPDSSSCYSFAILNSGEIFAVVNGGLYVSTDNGNSWTLKLPHSYGLHTLKLLPDNVLLAGSASNYNTDRVIKSTDLGETWEKLDNGLGMSYVEQLNYKQTVDNSIVYYAATTNGLFSYKDSIWSQIGTLDPRIYDMTSEYINIPVVLTWADGISYSIDEGNSWQSLINSNFPPYVNFFVIKDDSTFFSSRELPPSPGYEKLIRSTDRGLTWENIQGFIGSSIVQCLKLSNNGFLFAGTNNTGLYRSTDNGTTWFSSNNGQLNDHINVIATDNLDKIYIGGEKLYVSDNYGNSWTDISPDVSEVTSIAFNSSNVIFAGTIDGKVYMSDLQGDSWELVYVELQTDEIKNIEIPHVGKHKDNIFLSIPSSGIIMSSDNGQTWHSRIDGIEGQLNSKIISDSLGRLYVATYSNGLYRNTKTISDIKQIKETQPSSYKLSQNYPNPFNPTTAIKYQIPQREFVTLKVFDLLGNEIATLVNEEKPVGRYEVKFNASGLASGVYIYRMKVNNFIESKKMIVLK